MCVNNQYQKGTVDIQCSLPMAKEAQVCGGLRQKLPSVTMKGERLEKFKLSLRKASPLQSRDLMPVE